MVSVGPVRYAGISRDGAHECKERADVRVRERADIRGADFRGDEFAGGAVFANGAFVDGDGEARDAW